nr:MAG TPA: hypothetical protein [Caudoviricetes sp.]
MLNLFAVGVISPPLVVIINLEVPQSTCKVAMSLIVPPEEPPAS